MVEFTHMPHIMSIANQKGGVGKTTTTRHLAESLAERAIRVLVVDNDHQANLTTYFGLDAFRLESSAGTLYHALIEGKPVTDILIHWSEHIDVVPSALSLAEAGAQLGSAVDVNGALRNTLAPILDRYQVVLIDCGPNLERLLINALVVSTSVLIPVKTDMLSVSGIRALMQTILKVRQGMNPALSLFGILPTMYHKGRTADEEALRRLRSETENAGVPLFAPIPAATNYDKAAGEQNSVFKLYPDTAGAAEYEQLAAIIQSKL